ncbi:MAG: putative lipid II flippase FtsW [Succinatimonas sp.]|nr:putative lipid II flippase FtsW [Succinatimonas sp.]
MASSRSVGYDRWLLLDMVVLLCIGVVMISSASIMESFMRYGDELYQMKKHLMTIVMALFCSVITVMIPTKTLNKFSLVGMMISLTLLILVLIVGREINEAKRWINLGFFNLQPAEVLKICWILYFSSYTTRKIDAVSNTLLGFLKPLVFIGIMAGLLLAQPDFGSTMVVASITFAILWVAGAGFIKYVFVLLVGMLAAYLVVIAQPYRLLRVTSFLDPWADQFGSGYQLTQSLMAFGRGGIFGQGLGNSIQKLGYLPEAHNDFVMAILGEEFGFIGVCVVLFLEMVIVFKALKLAFSILRHNALFQGYVAYGIGIWFFIQTVINIGVASGAFPTKGLTLPLISYGGSAMIVSMCACAILLRIDYEWRNRQFGFSKNEQ